MKTAYAQAKTCQCRRMGVAGYCLLVLAVGIYGLYKVITDATVAKLEVVGSTTPVETQQVMRYVQPIVKITTLHLI